MGQAKQKKLLAGDRKPVLITSNFSDTEISGVLRRPGGAAAALRKGIKRFETSSFQTALAKADMKRQTLYEESEKINVAGTPCERYSWYRLGQDSGGGVTLLFKIYGSRNYRGTDYLLVIPCNGTIVEGEDNIFKVLRLTSHFLDRFAERSSEAVKAFHGNILHAIAASVQIGESVLNLSKIARNGYYTRMITNFLETCQAAKDDLDDPVTVKMAEKYVNVFRDGLSALSRESARLETKTLSLERLENGWAVFNPESESAFLTYVTYIDDGSVRKKDRVMQERIADAKKIIAMDKAFLEIQTLIDNDMHGVTDIPAEFRTGRTPGELHGALPPYPAACGREPAFPFPR